ncbi:MAG: hypothetical protein KF757_06310 [Phycisphaeraceae bacterium]|nr:hypothetical protein [Phycisphaeraceae bacterium]MCW5763216.1 hypothetical protein [Phycisphaeraceae bacterium]
MARLTDAELIALLDKAARDRATELDLRRTLEGRQASILASRLPALAEHLTTLNVWDNRLGAEGATVLAPALEQLTSLKWFNLGANSLGPDGVAELAPTIARLTNLIDLDLTENGIGPGGAASLASALERLTSLTGFYLSYNDFGPRGMAVLASGLKHLTRLNVLDLGNNCMGPEGASALALALERLTSLTLLDLRNNGLDDDAARALLALTQPGRPLATLQRLFLFSNPITILSDEVVDTNDPALMRRWLEQAGEPLWAAKVVILGDGRLGKTHLRERVFGDDPLYYNAHEPSTHNIAHLRVPTEAQWEGGTQRVTLLVWDFGGQSELHSAHRFFLSDRRNLFLVVVDAARSRAGNHLDYWLRTIAEEAGRRGDGSGNAGGPPVIVVIAGCDRVPAGQPRPLEALTAGALREQTGLNILAVVDGMGWNDQLSRGERAAREREHRDAITRLRAIIDGHIAHLPGVSTPYPEAFHEVAAWLDDEFPPEGTHGQDSGKSQKYVTTQAYKRTCEEYGLHSSLRDVCLHDLRNLGVLHYVGDDPTVRNSSELADLLFNPRWVKGPAYTLVRAGTGDHEYGVITAAQLNHLLPVRDTGNADADELWQRLSFSQPDRRRVLELMKACELIFDIEGEGGRPSGAVLVPDLLERRRAPFVKPDGATCWAAKYEHLPEWMVLRFIGRRYRDILDPQTQLFRDQFTLSEQDCRATVRISLDQRKIDVWIDGDTSRRERVFGSIMGGLNAIRPAQSVRQEHEGALATLRKLAEAEYEPKGRRGLYGGLLTFWEVTVRGGVRGAIEATKSE